MSNNSIALQVQGDSWMPGRRGLCSGYIPFIEYFFFLSLFCLKPLIKFFIFYFGVKIDWVRWVVFQSYKLAELSTHKSLINCWTILSCTSHYLRCRDFKWSKEGMVQTKKKRRVWSRWRQKMSKDRTLYLVLYINFQFLN